MQGIDLTNIMGENLREPVIKGYNANKINKLIIDEQQKKTRTIIILEYNGLKVGFDKKYIDVNISTQRMCAYLAGGVQVNCWAITTGRNGWNTPTGTFLISRKTFVNSMPNPPSPYPLNNIHYVSYFTGQGHAIHEAWWRSSFGGPDYTYNGSHGCVNAPIGVAQFIYDWAPIGTPVITHY
jgi:lipoprotein-anchoring transpeptidase ErfK/SrfK